MKTIAEYKKEIKEKYGVDMYDISLFDYGIFSYQISKGTSPFVCSQEQFEKIIKFATQNPTFEVDENIDYPINDIFAEPKKYKQTGLRQFTYKSTKPVKSF